ncbi:hypothetical protein OpiT1DRAFT_02240 [Opitutaceae bacterium TAV1]|nr:hypothetical protein OpiT1DRAFT_02240 [Opitutaceae bacterium TAV1]
MTGDYSQPSGNISTKTVADLEGMHFIVPAYQRGYRWTDQQVRQLLEDLFAWHQSSPQPITAERHPPKAPAYCLQPLVVFKSKDTSDNTDNTFSVVDGQQRLTTLYLILKNLHKSKPSFTLCYERHTDGGGKTGDLSDLLQRSESSDDTPDLHFLKKARDTIAEWMEDEPQGAKALADLLSVRADLSPRVQFIWHELPKDADPIAAFERLNSGKIALTDAELIRGLLLKRSSGASDATRQRIALRWDHMERRLRADEFWAFLGGEIAVEKDAEIRVCHIAHLFALHFELEGKTQRHALFHKFEEALGTKSQDALWDEIEDLFGTLVHWFEDTTLYHLIGLLIYLGEPPGKLHQQAKSDTKSAFVRWLKTKLRQKAAEGWTSPDKLRPYLDNIQFGDQRVKRLLLCFNAATLERDPVRTVRLSFYRLRNDQWDIEHIRATQERQPTDKQGLLLALSSLRDYVKSRSISEPKTGPDPNLDRLGQLLQITQQKDPFKDWPGSDSTPLKNLYEEVIKAFGSENDHGASNDLSNLTLLDAKTNRGYGAAPFAVKRWWIVSAGRSGRYILPCTLSVFTKAYTPAPINLLHWTPDDAVAYIAAVTQTLDEFFRDTWQAQVTPS